MNSFTNILNRNTENSLAIDAMRMRISVKSIQKGKVLQRQGDTISNVYYVTKGLLRSYTIDEKGKEHIFMFAPESWLISDGSDLDSPSDLFIDALEDSEVEVIDKKILHKEFLPLNVASDEERTMGLIKRIAVLQKRVIMLMSATAIERYEHFEATYPQIIQRVPQKMIASYLGITPEALSKVKGLKARQK